MSNASPLNIRCVNSTEITKAIKNLCIAANKHLPCDLVGLINSAKETETNTLGKEILNDLIKNIDAAKELDVPICQDTGMAVVFIELGQDVHITGDSLENAVNQGVREGYLDGCLRCSIVSDPLNRINTDDNTPAIIHLKLVDGDQINITVAPKGFGSENMSAIKMFQPSANSQDIIDFVCSVVQNAGANPCPPIIVGVGIGGDFEFCALLAKKALCQPVSTQNPDSFYAELEQKMLDKINKLGIGVQGFGGDTTALAVKILQHPTHIAGLPVAVNIGCHVTRHKSCVI